MAGTRSAEADEPSGGRGNFDHKIIRDRVPDRQPTRDRLSCSSRINI